MTIEASIYSALASLVSNRVYPDVAPATAALPRIVYQQVGGSSIESLDVGRVGHRNARIQVSVWASTRVAASDLARTVEDTLMASDTLRAVALGAMVADYEPDTLLYGARQDFSVWI